MEKNIVSCSILNVDIFTIENTLKLLEKNKIEYLHFDVMDGNFVNNISFGASYLNNITSKKFKFMYDVHLMIADPEKYYLDFIKAKADIITFHIESYNFDFDRNIRLINQIKSNNVKVGLSIKPNTNIEEIYKYLKYIDLVLIMSVEPGFGGQKFLTNTYEKIKKLKKEIKDKNLNVLISVDGGINELNSKQTRECGADILVSGSYLINDIENRVKLLR